MKLYISIPISGRPLHEAKAHAERIKAKLSEYGHECITPFDVCPEPDKSYGYYMGRDIEALLADDIDGIILGIGFADSKGCQLEHAAAEIYGKHIIHESVFDVASIDPKINNPHKSNEEKVSN